MEDDAAMQQLLEYVERLLEDMDKERETELRAIDGQAITQ